MSFQRFGERLKEYFTFTKRERNGILMLMFLIIAMQGIVIFTHYLQPTLDNPQRQFFEKEIIAFEKAISADATDKPLILEKTISKDTFLDPLKINYTYFDPNKADRNLWLQLGVSEKTIQSIANYISKGGRFKKKEDLRKIYTLKPVEYLKLEPYIVIDNKKEKGSIDSAKQELSVNNKSNFILELNKATQEDLMKLPLIGEKRAQQIIKYRNLLGGFVEKEQLKEIYGLPDSVYQLILPQITVNSDVITHLNINTDSISSLKHLYIKKPFAQMIVNYRLQHGDFHSVEEIQKLPLSSDSIFRKIRKYLIVE